MRLDQYLVEHHGFTRNKAQQLITSGLISINNKICVKPSTHILTDSSILITQDRRVDWVSRSAEKLASFIEMSVFRKKPSHKNKIENFDLKNLIGGSHCLDIGSSTGGFTQVLLQYGAIDIDAVDVGTDQLHVSIRSDQRVHSYEQTDIRDFAKKESLKPYDIIVCDASFISLSSILDSIISLADIYTLIVLLYKPQFEVGREHLRKTGVPKNKARVQEKMKEFELLLSMKNMDILDFKKSSLIGEAGNQEWIYLIQKNSEH